MKEKCNTKMESLGGEDAAQLDIDCLQQGNENDIDSCGAGDGGLDTKRSFSEFDSLSDQGRFNDTGDYIDHDGFDGKEVDYNKKDDPIFDKIKDSIARCHSSAKSQTSSSDGGEGSPHVKVAKKFISLPYGLVPWASYEHGKRSGDIMGVTYNGRMRQFIILDSKGITSWKRDAVDHRVCRDLHYPKYEYRLITNVIYAKKHNCYFVLGKDFSLKVWKFHQQSGITPTMLRPLANYGLTLKYELPSVGGSWVKRVELDHHLEHLYCCSDTDLHVYDLLGKQLFKFERAHMMSITGCRYSQAASVLVTSSIDCEVKVWSLMGGLIHTFRGHSRAVTNLLLHPATSSIVLTCSLDGTVRMWSLDTMDCIYSLVVSADGLLWMGLTDDNMLFISTARAVTLWHMNYTVQFWALARSRVTRMELCGCKEKTTRLMAISEDSSVRLMARSNRKNLCTVLPPPSISPLQRVLSVCYSREFDTIYMLINPHEIWVYTTRTDPACRIAVWDVVDVQASFSQTKTKTTSSEDFNPSSISVNKPAPSHRATESGAGTEPVANCCCLAILNSTAIVWTDEGCCCPIRDSYLLLGLEDGRILFMDPVKKGHKYLEFKTGKDPVLDMYHDTTHQALVTVYKLPGMMQIHVWGLPDLELQHEVYTSPDLRGHARLGYMLVTAHESGSVMFHTMELATDPGLHKPKSMYKGFPESC
ncbi:WD repeat-containing protein 87 [Elysia marginata]|uniref:WD repeat-containing protein 87 n=1 Tax=Elysia marginata TaxID=1093978 RepID=A0AAV4H1S9_9GAST|nr:WD repeat-containing protein 87 [Elysia marginata]